MKGGALWVLVALTTIQAFPTAPENDACVSEKRKLESEVCSKYSCRGRCDNPVDWDNEPRDRCQCNEECYVYGNCCRDFSQSCPERSQIGQKKYSISQFVISSCIGNISILTITRTLSRPNIGGINHPLSSGPKSKMAVSTTTKNESSIRTPRTGTTKTNGFDVFYTAPGWAIKLTTAANIKVDTLYGRLLHGLQGRDGFCTSDETTQHQCAPLNSIVATLALESPFSEIAELNWNTSDIVSIRFIRIPDDIRLKHVCVENERYRCSSCDGVIHPLNLCADILYGSRKNDTDVEKSEAKNEDSDSESMCSLDVPQAKYRLAKVTVIPPKIPASVTAFVSEDLPWAEFVCDTVMTYNNKCAIQSCAAGWFLSPNRQACVAPTQISVLVVRRKNRTSRATSSNSNETSSLPLSPPQSPDITVDASSSSTSFLEEDGGNDDEEEMGSPLKIGTGKNRRKVPAPFGLCLALYQLLQRHTEWIVHGISLRENCRYGFDPRTRTVHPKTNNKRADGLNSLELNETHPNREAEGDSGVTADEGQEESGFHLSKERSILGKDDFDSSQPSSSRPKSLNQGPMNLIDGASFPNSHVLDSENSNTDRNLTNRGDPDSDKSNTDTNIPTRRDPDSNKSNTDTNVPTRRAPKSRHLQHSGPTQPDIDGIQQVWHLIQESLSDLPDVAQLLEVELCFGIGPDPKCVEVEEKDEDICKDRFPVCSSYQLLHATQGALALGSNALSTYLPMPGGCCIWCLLVVMLIV